MFRLIERFVFFVCFGIIKKQYNNFKKQNIQIEILKMKKRSKIAFLIAITISLGAQNSQAFSLPDMQNRAVFGKCLIKSIRHTMTNKAELDRDWNTIYQAHNTIIQDPKEAAQNFKQIIKNKHANPTQFKLGFSSSAYQFEGGIGNECASTRFYKKENLAVPGKACDFWNNYEVMIKEVAQQTHVKTFRLEVLWSRVQPHGPNNFDEKAIQHYKEIIKTIKKYNIEPLVVFHHYTIPTWFEDIGGFGKKENINHFVNFCTRIYQALQQEVTYWSTFNAIEGYTFKGYFLGNGAPGFRKKKDEKEKYKKTAIVIKNMLESHVRVYKAIKELYKIHAPKYKKYHAIEIPEPQIGIQKNILPFDPLDTTWKQKLLSLNVIPLCRQIKCDIGNMFQNEGFYNFFSTGTYQVYIPTKVFVAHKNSDAPNCLDWIGVNHYSNRYMQLWGDVEEQDSARQTRNPNYRFYPEGIYRAIEEVANRIAKPIGKRKGIDSIPIWITENGIPTEYDNEADDAKRTRFFQQALFTISQAIEDGYRVEAYLPWSSHDNYEWGAKEGLGTNPYGFFYVDPKNPSSPHQLKKGSQYFCNFVKAFYNT